MKTDLTIDSNRERLEKIIDELTTKSRVDRPQFFSALELLGDIAKDCYEQLERLQQANTALYQQNITLAGIANYRVRIVTGKQEKYRG